MQRAIIEAIINLQSEICNLSRRSTLVLLLILLGAVAFRFYRIDAQSLWSDEGSSVAQALRDLPSIIVNSAQDIHPPLYYVLLHFWIIPFGTSEMGVRSLSAMLGVMLVGLCYGLGKALWDGRTGLMAAALAAINPFQVYYAQEARMYMLMAVLGALGVYATVKSQNPEPKSQRWHAVYLIAAVMGLYTHYLFPIVLVVCNVVFALKVISPSPQPLSLSGRGETEGRDEGWASLALWLVIQLVTFLAFLPWLPTAIRQITGWPAGPQTFSASEALLVILRTLSEGLSAPRDDAPWLALFAAALLLGIVPSFVRRLPSVVVVLYLLAPIVVMFTFALFKDAFLKFLLVASPPFVLLVAHGISNVAVYASRITRYASRPVTAIILVALALASVFSIRNYYFDPRFARDDYRAIAQTIAALARADDAIILDAPGQQEIFSYYYRGALPIYPLPRQRPANLESTRHELEAIAAQHRNIFAVLWATDESDPLGVVVSWLATHTFQSTEQWFGNVRLARFTSTHTAELRPINAHFSGGITLVGYRPSGELPAAGDVLPITLVWQVEQPIRARYKVFVHLLDPRGFVIAQRDAEPVGGSRPTTTWQPGETIEDAYGLFIPFGTPPFFWYQIEVGLYDPETGQRLKTSTGADAINTEVISVREAQTAPPLAVYNMQSVNARAHNGVQLIGYRLDKLGAEGQRDVRWHAGDALHLVLFWRKADGGGDGAYRLSLGTLTRDIQPFDGLYPVGRWRADEVVRDDQIIALPSDWRAGTYALKVNEQQIAVIEVR